MRKNFFISALMLLLPMLASALTTSELAGTWASELRPMEENENLKMDGIEKYKFDHDGNVVMGVDIILTIKEKNIELESIIKCDLDGKYKIDGDNITLICENPKVKLSSTREDIKITTVAELDPQKEQFLKEFMYQLITSSLIPELEKDAPDFDEITNWTNVSVTSNNLTYVEDGESTTLTKQ